jgi:hypothetical protein
MMPGREGLEGYIDSEGVRGAQRVNAGVREKRGGGLERGVAEFFSFSSGGRRRSVHYFLLFVLPPILIPRGKKSLFPPFLFLLSQARLFPPVREKKLAPSRQEEKRKRKGRDCQPKS